MMQDSDISAVDDMFGGIGRQKYPAQDLSVENWMRQNGANDRMIDIADACYANDFGCSLVQMGLRETILENRRWDSGRLCALLNILVICIHKTCPRLRLRLSGRPVRPLRDKNQKIEHSPLQDASTKASLLPQATLSGE